MRKTLFALASLAIAVTLSGCYVYGGPYGFGGGVGPPYYASGGGYYAQPYYGGYYGHYHGYYRGGW